MEQALPGDVSTIYKVDSYIILANTIYFVKINPVEAMFGIIKKWKCGEIKFKEAEDEVTLRTMAKESIKTIGLSKVNIEVDFIELSKTKEHEKYKHLQKVNVGDKVIVRYKDFDIDIKVPQL